MSDEGETQRLRMLEAMRVLDTDPEPAWDKLTELAALICGVPVALVSLVDADRLFFKSRLGLDVAEVPRVQSFCSDAIASQELYVVEDAHQHAAYRDAPLVVGDPFIRFYAGATLAAPTGEVLGTLCVLDDAPRALDEAQLRGLRTLADLAEHFFALRYIAGESMREHIARMPLEGVVASDDLSRIRAVLHDATRA